MRTTNYTVAGLAAGYNTARMISRIGILDGVLGVSVDLVAGGESQMNIVSDAVVSAEALRAAVHEGVGRVDYECLMQHKTTA